MHMVVARRCLGVLHPPRATPSATPCRRDTTAWHQRTAATLHLAAPDAREPPFESVPEAMPEALPSESEAPAFTPDEDRADAVSESEAPAPALATLGNS